MKRSLILLLAASACATARPAPATDYEPRPLRLLDPELHAMRPPAVRLLDVTLGLTMDSITRGAAPGGTGYVLCSSSTTQAAWTLPAGCGITSGAANVTESSIVLGDSGIYSLVVTGQAWVTATSKIVCAPLGTTADGLTPEAIAVGGLDVAISDRVVGTGFTIWVTSYQGLSGTVRIQCHGV